MKNSLIHSLIEREDLDAVLKEQSLSESGLSDEKGIGIGKLLSASRHIMGAFTESGNSIRIDARVTDTQSGKNLRLLFNLETVLRSPHEIRDCYLIC